MVEYQITFEDGFIITEKGMNITDTIVVATNTYRKHNDVPLRQGVPKIVRIEDIKWANRA